MPKDWHEGRFRGLRARGAFASMRHGRTMR
ncbi:hypothetical protein [Bifidobacterium adolescentis]